MGVKVYNQTNSYSIIASYKSNVIEVDVELAGHAQVSTIDKKQTSLSSYPCYLR